jgi:hypothetical protein
MDAGLRNRIERVRSALEEMPAGALVGWIHPGRRAVPESLCHLEQVADFLRVADGVSCHDFILFGAERLGEVGAHEWLPGGAGQWLTVGRNHVFPLVLDRGTEEVAELDADGTAEIIRRLGPFTQMLKGLFGPEYLALSYGLGEEWHLLLRRLGFA